MKVKLISKTENPIEIMEFAASRCYNSTPSKNGKIIKHCYNNAHHSVLEHCNFTFHIEEVSRALLGQLTRHRIANYSVRSQRYCSEDNFSTVVPNSIKNDSTASKEYDYIIEAIRNTYNVFVEEGDIEPEDARSVLPNSTYTELVMTINLRSLINFMNLRLCTRAQNEIRELANMMKNEIIKSVPEIEYMLVPKCEKHSPYNFCTESTSCGRHPLLSEVYDNSK